MSPVKVPLSSDEPRRVAARGHGLSEDPGGGPSRDLLERGETEAPARWSGSAATASAAAWLIYTAIYAVVFVLSGFSAPIALRGAIANALPDGLLGLAVIAATRRVAWRETGRWRFHLAHAALAPSFAALATGAKTALLWADVAVMRDGQEFRLDGGILAWQVFTSLLVYVGVAGAAYAQENARRLRSAAEAASRAETLRARAELSALRAQLNPHFLFNVLHSVLGLVRRDPSLAERALERLGDLMRYALHVHRDGVDWTALRNEWEFMECYLELERIRLGERLQVSLQADPAALERAVPTFSLQPLVENAVRHGVAPRAAGGRLQVSATLVGDSLRLEVANDGDPLHAPESGGEPGLGLRVLHERLEVLYSGRAAISAGPAPEGGYQVVLDLPQAGSDEEEEE